MMFNKNIQNFSYIEIFLILSYLICWFSISTSFNDILNFSFYNILNWNEATVSFPPTAIKENNSLNILLNFLRQFLNLILFPILLLIFFKKYQKIDFRNEFLFIFASLYFIFQIPGLIFSNNSFTNIIYVISALNILLIFTLINVFFDKKKYQIFFIITFLMLLLISVLNYKAYINFFALEHSSSLYTFFFSNETYLGKQSPRSTGSSRSLLLLMIISYILFIKLFEKKKIIKIIIYTIISAFILLFQSRTTITLLIVFILINFIFEKRFSLIDVIKYFCLYCLLPIILLYTILFSKQFLHNNNFIDKINDDGVKDTIFVLTDNFKRPINPETYSSGRFNDWKNILSNIDQSIIFGYGAQGDRFLIDQSASNGILYALTSSGVMGTIPFLFFSVFVFYIIFKKFIESFLNDTSINYYYPLVILLLLLRSILESSYAVFSVDFIVIYTFVNYLLKYSLKNNNGN